MLKRKEIEGHVADALEEYFGDEEKEYLLEAAERVVEVIEDNVEEIDYGD